MRLLSEGSSFITTLLSTFESFSGNFIYFLSIYSCELFKLASLETGFSFCDRACWVIIMLRLGCLSVAGGLILITVVFNCVFMAGISASILLKFTFLSRISWERTGLRSIAGRCFWMTSACFFAWDGGFFLLISTMFALRLFSRASTRRLSNRASFGSFDSLI